MSELKMKSGSCGHKLLQGGFSLVLPLTCMCMCRYPFDIPSEAFSFLRFKQAFAAIQASIVHLQVSSHGRPYKGPQCQASMLCSCCTFSGSKFRWAC